ncbi:tRNA pseudouridine(55) synthase TruB [Reyranella aquatilis]|jgi:tRNA pseudouridine55 synthase|uniref:tRNA pseudouridine synthase B n=1 Tax=Reyranella aquatilis TaxID=2035356 RepID=A0ABS8KSD5_9HYPH|nr:tRNA pseudouridine(55) synthase TruB [Reyranella aquatilis]MCC8428991.1 tRNA pseudouridine(55) synthase TruB [Reyranella aquatilis]
MARRKKGEKIDGWVVLDKPVGLGSTPAVGRVRRLFGAQKAGHGGTLDPLASGILPIALGEATKTVPFIMDGRKEYRFTLRFGEARSTEDAEGEVTATSDARPTDDALRAALPAFVGEIEQMPPAFSALKIDGKRAYDLARAGETVELKPRRVLIERLEMVGRPDRDHADFVVGCGKGTYIRSLGRDLAKAVGTVGHLSALRRTVVGPFREAAAISLPKLEALGHIPALFGALAPVATALDDIPALAMTEAQADRLRQGQPVFLTRDAPPSGALVRAEVGSRLVALVRSDGVALQPVRVFNL